MADVSTLEKAFPALFTVADQAAVRFQVRHLRITLVGLLAGVVAAVGSALTVDLTEDLDLGGLISALGFLVGAGVTVYLLFGKGDQAWFRNRAAAESVRTLAWQYSMRGGAFGGTDPDDIAAAEESLRSIASGMPKVKVADTSGKACRVSDAMTEWRHRSLADRREEYLKYRVDNQLEYYADKADGHARRATFWLGVMIVLQLAGLVLALFRMLNQLDADVLGIAATSAAAALAWIQTKDSQNLAVSFKSVHRVLDDINERRGRGTALPDEDEWSDFVRDCEAVMSREHTMWLARRDAPAEH